MGSRDKGKREEKKPKKDRMIKIVSLQEPIPAVEVVKRPRKQKEEEEEGTA
jgi:hypothetical protein